MVAETSLNETRSQTCLRPGARPYGTSGYSNSVNRGIVHHALEVVVGARLEPVLGIQLDGPGEVVQAILRVPVMVYSTASP